MNTLNETKKGIRNDCQKLIREIYRVLDMEFVARINDIDLTDTDGE